METSFDCPFCSKKFNSTPTNNFIIHVNSEHSKEDPKVVCPICVLNGGDKNKKSQDIKVHLKLRHEETNKNNDAKKAEVSLISTSEFPSSKVTPLRFDKTKSSWKEVVTFNVWFGQTAFAERAEELIKIFKESEAHIIAMQEVTKDFIMLLTKNSWIQENCWISDINGFTINRYGVVFLFTIPIHEALILQKLPSSMGRKALIAKFTINETPFVAVTSHFESHDENIPTRTQQIQLIYQVVKNEPNVLLMGDFNSVPSEDEHPEFSKNESFDIWTKLNKENPGYTFDTTINEMAKRDKKLTGENQIRSRIDKFIFRCRDGRISPKKTSIIGDKSFGKDSNGKLLWPSDHFGVFVELEFKN